MNETASSSRPSNQAAGRVIFLQLTKKNFRQRKKKKTEEKQRNRIFEWSRFKFTLLSIQTKEPENEREKKAAEMRIFSRNTICLFN